MNVKFPEVDGLKDFPQNIAEKLLKEIDKYEGHKHPYWIQIMGIPGSGKTTLVRMLQQELNNRIPYTLAAFDEYMELIPEYMTEQDRAMAFAKFEEPARAVGFEIFKELIRRKVHVLFEHSTSFIGVRDLMYFVKQSGYKLILIRVEVDQCVAKARVKAREEITKRHVPESLIDERFVIIQTRWEELTKIADLNLSVVNNGDVDSREVFRKTIDKVKDSVHLL